MPMIVPVVTPLLADIGEFGVVLIRIFLPKQAQYYACMSTVFTRPKWPRNGGHFWDLNRFSLS